MNIVFYLSGENTALAKEEVLALTKSRNIELHERLLVIKAKYAKIFERLAYTRKVYKLLFTSSYERFLSSFKKYKWSSVYKSNFSLIINNLTTYYVNLSVTR